MTITFANMRAILDSIIEDPDTLAMTTSATGGTDKLTLIDATLKRQKDGYYGGWFVWLTAAAEERLVKTLMSTSGTLEWYEAATDIVAASASYKLWKYSNAMKLSQLNRAIRFAYPRFYNPVANETLFGQNAYGETPNEFNKFIYAIPSGFEGYPDEIWTIQALIGTHDGSDDASVLTDSGADWIPGMFTGLTLYNKTDGSSGTVTGNTATTITCTLASGTDNDWDTDDEYIIQHPSYEPERLSHYTILDPADSTKRFRADIAEDKLITLIGKGRLSEFTTEASTTELSDAQAEVVCQKAAGNIYHIMASKLDGKNREGFTELFLQCEAMYEGKSRQDSMPDRGAPVIDRRWAVGRET